MPGDSTSPAMTAAARAPLERAWWCAGRVRLRIPNKAARLACQVWAQCEATGGQRWVSDRWLRYNLPLRNERGRAILQRVSAKQLRIEPLTEEMLAECAALAPTANQIVTARSLWNHGLRRAYAARAADGQPLGFVWVLTSDDNAQLATLPCWSGVYSPIPAGWVQLENVLSLGRSLSRGRIMTDLAFGAVARTDIDAVGIVAHIGATNHLVRRWIESLGCQQHGQIVRMRIDLPLLRQLPVHIHTVEPRHPLGATTAAARQAGSAAAATIAAGGSGSTNG